MRVRVSPGVPTKRKGYIMILTFISLTEDAITERDYCDIYAIEIDGKRVFCVADGESEDNTLFRNFNDVYKLEDILSTVYEAGVAGKRLEIEYKEVTKY